MGYAKILFASYPKAEVDEPTIYLSNIVALLTAYPEEIVRSLVDPRTGIHLKSPYLPKPFDVRAACEAKMKPILDAERRRRIEEQNAADRPKQISPEEAARRKEFIEGWRRDMERKMTAAGLA